METNNHKIVDYSAVLDKQYGKSGTPERKKFDDEAYAFYTSQILLEEITMDLNVSPLDVMRNAADYPVLSKKATVLKNLAKMFDTLSDLAETSPLDKLLDEMLDRSGYREFLKNLGDDGVNRLENINELKSTMMSYSTDAEDPSLNGFLEEIGRAHV